LAVLALALANMAFFYFKTRPKPPEIVLEQTLSWLYFEDPADFKNAVHLDSSHQWRNRNGEKANLVLLADLAVPNIDGPEYSISVEQRNRWTIGDMIENVRSAAKEGICNLVILDKEMRGHEKPKSKFAEVPYLTVTDFSSQQGGPLKPCLTDAALDQRIARAIEKYEKRQQKSQN
jgi:hypothetical protein